LGGGAGGGHQNDATATPGTNGGGLIIITSNAINAGTGAVRSSALNAVQAATDGSGGAGAGGTVLLQTTAINGNLLIDVHGGNGGDNNTHGTGGGGGGGIVWTNVALPPNVTTDVSGGQPGFHSGTNGNHGATAGGNGSLLSGLSLVESNTPFSPLPKPLATAPANVCATNAITLSVGTVANVTYSWTGSNGFTSALQNPVINNATPSASGNYIIAIQNTLGCVERDTVLVTVHPTAITNVNATICSGELYIRPNGTSTTTQGIYNDTLQTTAGCDSTIITNLSITTIPLTANPDTAICRGNPVQLTAAGGFYYKWSPASSLSDSSIANPIATPTQTTQYIVKAYSPSQNLITNGNFENGNVGFTSAYQYKTPPNTSEGQYFVGSNAQTWNGGMTPCGDHTSGSGNMMLVNGATVANQSIWCQTLAVQPNVDYAFSTWVQMVVGSNPAILQFSINGTLLGSPFTPPATPCSWAEFYQLWNSGTNTFANICIVNQNTGAGGNDFGIDDISFSRLCEATDTVTIQINLPDTVYIYPEICVGNTYTLPGGSVVNTAGIYVDSLVTQLGCDSIVVTTLTTLPTFNDTMTATICSGKDYALPDGTIVNSTGAYTSNLQSQKGCDSVIVTLLDVLPNSFTLVDTFVCQNTPYIRPSGLVATAAGFYNDTLSAANLCDSIITTHLQYHPSYLLDINDTICAGQSYTLPDGNAVALGGNYTININSVHGCDSVFQVSLVVLDVLLSAQVSDVTCFGAANGQVQINASGGVADYTFVSNSGNSLTGTASVLFTNLNPGIYTFNVTDTKGCIASIGATITEPVALEAQTQLTNVSCHGKSDGQVQLNATGGTAPYLYQLGGITNSSGLFSNLIAGNYSAAVTDAANCTITVNFTVTEPNDVTLQFQPQQINIDMGKSANVNVSSNFDPFVTYSWSPTQGLSCADCSNPEISAVNTTTYTVQAIATINGNECAASEHLVVTVIPNYDLFIPNAFSPNGDGANDMFMLYGNLQALKQIQMRIFNRWGEKVFETNNINFQWDGTFVGAPLPPGVYTYTLQAVFLNNYSDANLKGSLTVIK